MDIILDSNSFLTYAVDNYDNPQCVSSDEFFEDLNRFKYIKRLLRKYIATQDIQERLLLNHIIILYNVFNLDAATIMLFFKMEEELWSPLKSFLVYLNYMPEDLYSDIKLDDNINNILSKI